jgi:oligopeptide transport system permease protein
MARLKHIIHRLIASILVLFAVMTISFFVMRLAPGSPFQLEKSLPREIQKQLEESYHLDKPLYQQYVLTMKDYLSLDFGMSMYHKGRTVKELILETWPVTVELGIYGMIIALIMGLSSGFLAGWRFNTWTDRMITGASLIGISVPSMVLGPLLIYIVVLKLGWIGTYGGWSSWSVKLLPSFTLAVYYAGFYTRLSREGTTGILSQDYILAARAKGVPEFQIFYRHVLKGAIIPSVSYTGPALAHLLTGSVVVETIFNIPGLSQYFVASSFNRDYPLVMGVIILYSILLIFLNLCVDLCYVMLNPKHAGTPQSFEGRGA